jgi:hypothetical protein
LDAIDWAGRECFIAFDNDIIAKPDVAEAEDAFASEVSARGGAVRRVRFPPSDDHGKLGLDDYLVQFGDAAFEALCDNAEMDRPDYPPPVRLGALMKRDLPAPRWIWDELIPEGEVALLYGDGGVGKSLLALHLAIDVAAGRPCMEEETLKAPVLALFCEDSEASVQERARVCLGERKIADASKLPFDLWCKPSGETYLAVISDNGEVEERPMLHRLRAELKRIGPGALVILDSMADLFAMNENLRLPVNAAMKQVLGTLCRDYEATTLVLAHPSKASRIDGSNYSGSTAFNNAVRQRLTLTVEPEQPGLYCEGPPPRTLSVAKSNSGAMKALTLWYYGADIQPLPKDAPTTAKDAREAVLSTVLGLIDHGVRVVKQNGNVGDARTLNDLSDAIRDRTRLVIRPKDVKRHLHSLEDQGLLRYRASDKTKRPHVQAGYERGEIAKR